MSQPSVVLLRSVGSGSLLIGDEVASLASEKLADLGELCVFAAWRFRLLPKGKCQMTHEKYFFLVVVAPACNCERPERSIASSSVECMI